MAFLCISKSIIYYELCKKDQGFCFIFDLSTMRRRKHRYEETPQIVSLVGHPCLQVSLGAKVDFLQVSDPASAIQLIMFGCFSPLHRLFYIRHNIARRVWIGRLGLACYVSQPLKNKRLISKGLGCHQRPIPSS